MLKRRRAVMELSGPAAFVRRETIRSMLGESTIARRCFCRRTSLLWTSGRPRVFLWRSRREQNLYGAKLPHRFVVARSRVAIREHRASTCGIVPHWLHTFLLRYFDGNLSLPLFGGSRRASCFSGRLDGMWDDAWFRRGRSQPALLRETDPYLCGVMAGSAGLRRYQYRWSAPGDEVRLAGRMRGASGDSPGAGPPAGLPDGHEPDAWIGSADGEGRSNRGCREVGVGRAGAGSLPAGGNDAKHRVFIEDLRNQPPADSGTLSTKIACFSSF
jgi:hypothetical protein